MSVFKAYDIRGLYGSEIDANLARRIGRAYAEFMGKGPLVVGRDMRASSPEIQGAFIEGVRQGGLDVLDAGLCSTPQLYFAIGHLEAAGGVNITASHNAAPYTGIKLCREEARPISADDGILDLERMATDPHGLPNAPNLGGLQEINVLADYVDHVLTWCDCTRPMKLASDAANGMAAHTFPAVLNKLPDVEHHGLFFELDGSFPNHEANPLHLPNLADLCSLVQSTGSELGAAFDGDADRCCFVDELGRPIGNDIVTTMVAQEILKKEPGAAIVYDLRSSWILPETVRSLGGIPVEERVGHSFLKAKMRQHNAPFGGELSGHYYFRDNWFADNSEIILLSVMNLLSRNTKPFSEIVDELRCYHSTGEVNFQVDDKKAAIAKLRDHFSDGKQSDLDGVTIAYGDGSEPAWWWVNLRLSNTEPLLRMNLESNDESVMKARTEEVVQVLGAQPV